MASERPKKLSKVELEQYNVLLEEQAFPFEEKATELHEVNARRAASGVYDKWVQEQLRRVARAAPGALRQGRGQRRSRRCDPLAPLRRSPRARSCSAPAGCSTVERAGFKAVRDAVAPRRGDAGAVDAARPAAGAAAPARGSERGAAASTDDAGQPGDAARLRRRQPGAAQRPASPRPSALPRRSRRPIPSCGGPHANLGVI